MLSRLEVNFFKKFLNLKVENLSRINIIIGINNVGKTTVLEAIMGMASGQNLSSVLNFAVWRRFPQTQNPNNSFLLAELIANVFHNRSSINNRELLFSWGGTFDGKMKIFAHTLKPGQIVASLLPNSHVIVDGTEILHKQVPMPFPIAPGSSVMIDVPSQYLGEWDIVSIGDGEMPFTYELSTPIQLNQIPPQKVFFPAMLHDFTTYRNETEIAKVYSYLQNQDSLQVFVEEMNKSFPEMHIKTIENIPYTDGSAAPIRVKFDNGSRCPVYALGDGFRRWYELLGGMVTFPNSVHCIEEADATIHHEAQEGFSVNLARYAQKYNNQIFLTTHNVEYLETFLTAIEANEKDCLKNEVRVITLRHYGDEVRHRTLDGAEALKAIRRGLELRV